MGSLLISLLHNHCWVWGWKLFFENLSTLRRTGGTQALSFSGPYSHSSFPTVLLTYGTIFQLMWCLLRHWIPSRAELTIIGTITSFHWTLTHLCIDLQWSAKKSSRRLNLPSMGGAAGTAGTAAAVPLLRKVRQDKVLPYHILVKKITIF